MRHKWMEQPQRCGKNQIHHRERGFLFGFVRAENVGLGRFDKPVAVITPDKIIEMLSDYVEVIFTIRRLDCVDCLIQTSEHFDAVDRESSASLRLARKRNTRATLHLAKPRGVPKFCREV